MLGQIITKGECLNTEIMAFSSETGIVSLNAPDDAVSCKITFSGVGTIRYAISPNAEEIIIGELSPVLKNDLEIKTRTNIEQARLLAMDLEQVRIIVEYFN